MSSSRLSETDSARDRLNDQLESAFRRVFGKPDLVLNDEMTIDDFPEWDSVAHINLMFVIEQSVGVQFTGNELAEMQNIRQLKDFIHKKISATE